MFRVEWANTSSPSLRYQPASVRFGESEKGIMSATFTTAEKVVVSRKSTTHTRGLATPINRKRGVRRLDASPKSQTAIKERQEKSVLVAVTDENYQS